LCAIVTAAGLCGCKSTGGDDRAEHAARFEESLRAKTLETLPPGEAVTLTRCIEIALENNLDVKTRDIETQLARLDAQAAFASFLPTVHLRISQDNADEQQAVWTGAGYFPMSDQNIMTTTVMVQQEVFVPRSWFMYSMMREGEDLRELVAQRARQLVTLQVAIGYHQCLSLARRREYIERSVAAAERLAVETFALVREGMATQSALQDVELYLASRQNDLAANGRAQVEAKAVLLNTMGLYPLAEITLAGPSERPRDERALADEVTAALLNRLELAVADRAVEMSDNEVRMAVADFIPSLVLTGAHINSDDGYLQYSSLWRYGISGILTVFDGFQNVSAYRKARASREKAFARREAESLTVMLEVVKARQLADAAEDGYALAEKALAAAQRRCRESEALRREGMLAESNRLAAIVERDSARAHAEMADYGRQIARVTLAAAIGRPRRLEEQ
jgi:outer membrane protein TolC